jgi:hypothetical protein
MARVVVLQRYYTCAVLLVVACGGATSPTPALLADAGAEPVEPRSGAASDPTNGTESTPDVSAPAPKRVAPSLAVCVQLFPPSVPFDIGDTPSDLYNGVDVVTDPRSLDSIEADCVARLGVHCPLGNFISRSAAICIAEHEGWILPEPTRETAGLLFSNASIVWSVEAHYPTPVTLGCPADDPGTDGVGCPHYYEIVRVDALTGVSHGEYGYVGPDSPIPN